MATSVVRRSRLSIGHLPTFASIRQRSSGCKIARPQVGLLRSNGGRCRASERHPSDDDCCGGVWPLSSGDPHDVTDSPPCCVTPPSPAAPPHNADCSHLPPTSHPSHNAADSRSPSALASVPTPAPPTPPPLVSS